MRKETVLGASVLVRHERRSRVVRALLAYTAAVVASLACASLEAQDVESLPIPEAPPSIDAVSTEGVAITIDGHLDEAAWARAPYASGFRERVPHPDRRPPVDTRFRVLFDDGAIYFGLPSSL